MIFIEIYKQRGLYSGLHAKGHASFQLGARGSNPLCAGVSVLLQTLLLYLKKEKLVSKVKVDDGCLAFELVEIRNPKLVVQVDQGFRMTLIGLEEIQKNFPQDVQIQYFEDIFEETRAVS